MNKEYSIIETAKKNNVSLEQQILYEIQYDSEQIMDLINDLENENLSSEEKEKRILIHTSNIYELSSKINIE